jgi:hypothetical protein
MSKTIDFPPDKKRVVKLYYRNLFSSPNQMLDLDIDISESSMYGARHVCSGWKEISLEKRHGYNCLAGTLSLLPVYFFIFYFFNKKKVL